MDQDDTVKEIYINIPHVSDMDRDDLIDFALSYVLSNCDEINEAFYDEEEGEVETDYACQLLYCKYTATLIQDADEPTLEICPKCNINSLKAVSEPKRLA